MAQKKIKVDVSKEEAKELSQDKLSKDELGYLQEALLFASKAQSITMEQQAILIKLFAKIKTLIG